MQHLTDADWEKIVAYLESEHAPEGATPTSEANAGNVGAQARRAAAR